MESLNNMSGNAENGAPMIDVTKIGDNIRSRIHKEKSDLETIPRDLIGYAAIGDSLYGGQCDSVSENFIIKCLIDYKKG